MYIGWLEGRKKLSKKKIKAIQENGVVSDHTYLPHKNENETK